MKGTAHAADRHLEFHAAGSPQDRFTKDAQGLAGASAGGDDSLAVWVQRYLDLGVRGVRSAEVKAKIGRHLQRFQNWFQAGLGHDRVSAVTPREVAGWREHLAATVVRQRRDGGTHTMAPATVNNHLAHLSAFFTWTTAHTPTGLLPHGDPTSRVELLHLPAPEPRALSAAQLRTVKNVWIDWRASTTSAVAATARHRRGGACARPAAAGSRHRAPAARHRAAPRRARRPGPGPARAEHPAALRRAKRARLLGVRGKGRTSRTVFLGRDARAALADYLDHERPGDVDEASAALFVAASSIASRRPDGRLSARSVNTIVAELGRIHDLEVVGADRRLGTLRPHDLRHTFAFRLSAESGHNRAELERRLGHANDRYLRLYTNPPDEVAAGYIEDL